MDLFKKWAAMTAKERDWKTARATMGFALMWHNDQQAWAYDMPLGGAQTIRVLVGAEHGRGTLCWSPQTDARHDYEVLDQVRQWPTDKQKDWATALQLIYMRRDAAKPKDDQTLRDFVFMDCLAYQVGDYAHAAFLVQPD